MVFTSSLLMITTSRPAKPTAAMVAMAYSAVAAPSSDFQFISLLIYMDLKSPIPTGTTAKNTKAGKAARPSGIRSEIESLARLDRWLLQSL